jgi:hypothetical protein
MNIKSLLTLAATALVLSHTATGLAQGNLIPPPGAPAPVMKTLAQVEARTPLEPGAPGVVFTNGTYWVTQPGSYYLTGNLTATNNMSSSFIALTVDNVTLDLNGFTIFGTNGNLGAAIEGDGYGYRVINGHIVGGTTQMNGAFTENGFTYGVYLFSGSVNQGTDSLVSGITVLGTRDRAIWASLNSSIESCITDTSGAEGIIGGTISNCRAVNALLDAITGTTVLNSIGKSFTGRGIEGYESSRAENCLGESVSNAGISVGNALNCRGVSISGKGLYAETAMNCSGLSTSGIGLDAGVASNCTGTSTSGTYGLQATGTANSCRGNRPGGVAISAGIAIGCTSAAGSITSSQKHLGTP